MIKQTPRGTVIDVHVVPNSKAFAIAGMDWNGDIKIKVKSKANKGKANEELVTELRKRLSAEVEIITGHKSRQKSLLIKTDATTVKRLVK